MKHRFRIVDADGHVIKLRGMWERYIDLAARAMSTLNQNCGS
jgi:hypothetical protein